jgi:hypothetical protein
MKRGKRAAPGTLPRDFRTPPFYVEVDQARAMINVSFTSRFVITDKLSDTVGLAAKQLHTAAHIDPKFHKAFVYKLGNYYDFAYHRLQGGEIAATLTVLSDHRVRVTYHNGKEPETLYL